MCHSAGQHADRIHLLSLKERRLEAPALADLAIIRNEVCHSAFAVPHRGDGLFDSKRLPTFLAIDQHTAVDIAGSNRGPQLAVKIRTLLARFQNPRSLSDDFLS